MIATQATRRCVQGSWNSTHSIWTTADGKYKIVRRLPAKGVTPAWIARRANEVDGEETPRFSFARRIIAEQVKRDAGITGPGAVGIVKVLNLGGPNEKS